MKRVKVNFNFKSMALVLFALVLSSNVWGAEVTSVYSTGFEKCSTGTNYQGTVTIDTEKGDGASWTIYYGCVSTSSKISGNNSAQMRLYSNKNCGYLEQTSNIAVVDSINFKYAVSNKAVRFDVKYSTNSGSSWTTLASIAPSGTSSTTLAYRLPAQAATFRLKIEVTGGHPSSSNYTLRIDDVNYYKITAASKTLSSITVKTAPSKITYSEGDKFDPTGLVVTKKYSDNSTEDWAYASHASDFTFNPSTSTALTTSNKSVTITVGGKSTTQSITVNAKPKYTVTFYNAGEVVKTVSNVTEGTLFSVIKPTIGTGSGQLNIESCDNNSTHFMGWTKEESFQKRGSAPSYVADGTAINSNMELRAVWAAEQQ